MLCHSAGNHKWVRKGVGVGLAWCGKRGSVQVYLIFIICHNVVLSVAVGDVTVMVGTFCKRIADVCSLIIDCI